MVQALAHSSSQIALPAENIPLWLSSVSEGHSEDEIKQIHRAALFAIDCHQGQVRRSGEAYVNHTFAVAAIVHELGLDYEAIIAALLHDSVEDTDVTLDDLRQEFGESVAQMVNGVTKMESIQEFAEDEHAIDLNSSETNQTTRKQQSKERGRVESLRKMMLAMVEDVRVVLIKLSDRLHNMRTMEHMPADKQIAKSRETLEIFSPLANRLGVWQLKWELEDLAFRYLEPETYMSIAKKLKHRRIDRDDYISSFVDDLSAELTAGGINGDIKGRAKHIYSIWAKMQRKKLDFENVYDIRAVRVLVDSVQDCYATLGLIHTKWKYIPGEFDDYIATPKENNYQSIHTAVIGPQGRVIEIQIRTIEMHKANELGVAAHWRYKEGAKSDSSLENKILWLRQLMEWKDDVVDANEFVERVQDDVFEERIYVFTPKGKVVDLPTGATPIDFAYSIHTEVGHKCRGALVNGKMVPLTTKLLTGQRVEVVTNKNGTPSLDWLSSHHNYVKTRRARSAIQHYFRYQNRDETLTHGREILDKELHRMNVPDVNIDRLAKSMNLDDADDLYMKLVDGSFKPGRVSMAALKMARPDQHELFDVKDTETISVVTPQINQLEKSAGGKKDFRAGGVDNMLVSPANCCLPIPGDNVRGYITRGSGVSVHRNDCANLLNLFETDPDRVIEVDWYDQSEKTYPMSILVEAFDRKGLLNDISGVFTSEKVNVIEMTTRTDPKDQTVTMIVTAELLNIERMSQVINRIMQVPNVLEVRRKQ
jgi:GTP pyrophosphokinase